MLDEGVYIYMPVDVDLWKIIKIIGSRYRERRGSDLSLCL